MRTLSYGDTLDLTVIYRGENPQQGFFFDDESDDHPQMVSTDSWPDEAHHWIPCYDYPNDKVTHELIVTVPAGNRVLSNGRLVGITENEAAGTVTWHWSQDLPHATYLFMLAIGPFTVIEDSLGDLPVNYWVYPDDAEDARWIFAKTPRMILSTASCSTTPTPGPSTTRSRLHMSGAAPRRPRQRFSVTGSSTTGVPSRISRGSGSSRTRSPTSGGAIS
jgi:hypothetical protein